MNYLLLICIDGPTTPEMGAAMGGHTQAWVEEMNGRGVRLLGKQLDEPTSAKTVRVRGGETLVSDGPFADTKEYIGGLDVIECENLDEAIDVAAKHPVSWFHKIEVRPFFDDNERPGSFAPEPIPADAAGSMRYMLMMCLDGIPETPEVEEGVLRDGNAWRERVEARGAYVYGHALQHADTATTVRVRDRETLLTDGPFTETKEFLGGFALLNCETLQEAVELAAEHPLARFHMVEVRPFWEG
ncbi:MAG TPA: YciI family protein [Solirubrobacteraceae bacterium]|nr:YciI family protein [Solirubrobacteraceae bacterium]